MAITRKTPGYVTIGFSNNDKGLQMIGSDAVLGFVDGSGSKALVSPSLSSHQQVNALKLKAKDPSQVLVHDRLFLTNRSATEINGKNFLMISHSPKVLQRFFSRGSLILGITQSTRKGQCCLGPIVTQTR